MTDFEKQRLGRYIVDAGDWLTQIEQLLFAANTPTQAAASDFIRLAHESVKAAKRQLILDGTIGDEKLAKR